MGQEVMTVWYYCAHAHNAVYCAIVNRWVETPLSAGCTVVIKGEGGAYLVTWKSVSKHQSGNLTSHLALQLHDTRIQQDFLMFPQEQNYLDVDKWKKQYDVYRGGKNVFVSYSSSVTHRSGIRFNCRFKDDEFSNAIVKNMLIQKKDIKKITREQLC